MSIRNVAQLAGVSTSTVSRVLNERPNVAAATVESVRRAMRELSFSPAARRRGPRAYDGLKTATIAFMVLGTSGSRPAPAFEKLLRGVSEQSSRSNLNLIFSFVSDPEQLPPKIAERRVDGLLLHGELPTLEVQARLQSLPTVWLMANPQRPTWGDQVMPDNADIGATAAKYLLRRGHRRLAYLGAARQWSLETRSMSFAHAAHEAGAEVEIIETREEPAGDFWQRDGLSSAARTLADRLAHSHARPSGLFIAEDRLVPLVDAAMRLYGAWNDPSRDPAHPMSIISCNNERSHFAGLQFVPATIDIRAEAIGRLGVERLIWRLRCPDVPERIRCMVEPVLVEGGT